MYTCRASRPESIVPPLNAPTFRSSGLPAGRQPIAGRGGGWDWDDWGRAKIGQH